MNTGRESLAGAGTQTAALGFGGNGPPITGVTEEYNGTIWTSVNSMNTARTALGGAGLQTSALAFGGSPDGTSVVASTEEFTITGTAGIKTITVS